MSSVDIWTPELAPPGGRYFRLFISHTSAHKHDVHALSRELSLHGIAGFVAHDSIGPFEQWQDVISGALLECEALAAYLTDDFHGSDWTDQEVGAALARDLVVLPLKVDRDPYGFIGRIQAMPARGVDPRVLADRIASRLRVNARTSGAMAEATVDMFARSNSYAEARANLTRLRELPADAWTAELAATVREAIEYNGQLRNATVSGGSKALPAAVRDLLESLSL
jgi:hypothetical protein